MIPPVVDDSAAGMPMKGAAPVAAALDLMGRKTAPMACCPRDGEPLIMTLRYRGAEFVCLACEGMFGFLAPTPREPTDELNARYAEIKARWDAGERPSWDQL